MYLSQKDKCHTVTINRTHDACKFLGRSVSVHTEVLLLFNVAAEEKRGNLPREATLERVNLCLTTLPTNSALHTPHPKRDVNKSDIKFLSSLILMLIQTLVCCQNLKRRWLVYILDIKNKQK